MAQARNSTPTVTESTEEELAIQRYLLDLTLQPLESFDGFTILEQFGGTALRYQLNFISYALSMAQYTRSPAFTGYLAEAQRNAIDKMCDRRVWAYWAKENLIGYQRWNPDPIVHANVMYTGFFGAMIGLYETLNGHRYDEPGSLPLVYDDKHRYQYDFGSLSEAIVRNMRKGKQTQYPCEPHLIYPMCNAFAMNTLVMHDKLHGTELTGDIVERVQDDYTRFGYLTKDGRFLAGKGPLGVKFPAVVANDSIMSYWLHPTMPEQAERSWRLVRDRFIKVGDYEAEVQKMHLGERIDVGSYLRGDAMTRAVTMCAAAEHGDAEAAAGLERSLDSRHEIVRQDGARKYKGASVWANAAFALATFTRHNGVHDLVQGSLPDAWRTGPQLAEAAYPDVLVARAVSDGSALDLVLRPGNGTVRSSLKVERLDPGRAYNVSGGAATEVTADADGSALLDVELNGRTEVRLVPAG